MQFLKRLTVFLFIICFAFSAAACGGDGGSKEQAEVRDGEDAENVTAQGGSALIISEVMPANHATCTDSYGRFSDWIEIENTGDKKASLDGLYLSDKEEKLMAFALPETELAPGERLLIFADGTDPESAPAGELHAPFKLSSEGESVFLSEENGTVLSVLSYKDAAPDFAYRSDGSATPYATPGYPDTDAGYLAFNAAKTPPQGLCISELTNNNSDYITHDEYYSSDWVELLNNSQQSISLADYFLTDDETLPEKCALPDVTLEPGAYYVVTMDDPDEAFSDYVSGFTIGSEETLYLTRGGIAEDYVPVREITDGGSFGRLPEGGFGYYTEPTPGAANGSGAAMITRAPVMSEAEGVYNNITSLTVSLSGAGTIYYTTDGSRPTTSSTVYSEPVTLDKTGVIRAVAAEDGKLVSACTTASYIINENHTLPVLSLSVKDSDLFDPETGIFIEGNHNNYYQDWEKPANLTMFDESGKTVFNADCGMKMFGGESREICSKKSFRVGFKARYGTSHIDADIFGNGITKFKSLVVRGGEDTESTYFRTEAFSRLAEDMEVLTQSGKFCILYINGQYYGIYSLLERFSPYYLAQHFEVEEGICRVEQGIIDEDGPDDSQMLALIRWVEEHDLSDPDNYAYLTDRIDLESLIDWVVMEAYSRNGDISYNIRYCYSTDYSLKVHWALFDLDWGFYTYGDNFAMLAKEREYAVILQALLENDGFRQIFVDRMAYLFENYMTDDRMLAIIDGYHDLLAPEIPRERQRWGDTFQSPQNTEDWEESVASMRRFVTEQNIREEMILSFKEHFGLTESQEAQLNAAIGR